MAASLAARTPPEPAPMTNRSQSYSAIGWLHQIAGREPLDAGFGGDERFASEAEEEAVLDDAGDALQRRLDGGRVEDRTARRIVDKVAAVGEHRDAVLAAQAGRRRDATVGQAADDAAERRCVSEGDNFDRQRKDGAQPRRELGIV